ncbi:xylanase/chitin deacetylase family protein [Corallococcus coralloides DSM 2259]|uniref:Xylanase/chitin deacetylase family protein n=1 Tax=Corallococcus coralloides (strain ATCC 25202 / DSM 2259 / NBRC 100086 / M2) TaxID=1144275 RepID=H8N130_CORCM|nr:xylanase/chitin deacetylase [Corallococcus coralloides]AFE07196.1 xylanase/chitin deacetylase family protein [Corallococcus coralloides DSM 2259]
MSRSAPADASATRISIPVLCYHVVSTDPSGRYQLSVTKFKEQKAYLASNGFTTLPLDEYYSVMILQTPAPAKPIVLTFDDGTSDFARMMLREGSKTASVRPGAVRDASTLLRPPHREQAKTSSANVRRSSPAQSNRGVRSIIDSTVAA